MLEKKPLSDSPNPSVFDASDVLNPTVGHGYFSKKNIILGCIILTAIVILSIALYYYLQYQHAQYVLKNPLLASEMTQEKIVANVGKLTTLPTGEQPAIAKVSDVTKLENQPFFQNAKNGDFVLIYTKAKEAVLYDPTVNKVLRVGPILVPSPTAGTNQWALGAHTSNLPVTVALYNGTAIAGLAKKTEEQLTKAIKTVTVVTETNAAKQDYTKTLVIDLKGNNTQAAQQIASVLHGKVGTLPSGEGKPAKADLLVILGGIQQTPTP